MLKEKIKSWNNPVIKKLLFTRRLFKDENFASWVNDYDTCNTIVKFEELGKENQEKVLFFIEFNQPEFGFFAYWKFGLAAIAFAERYGFVPVIDWTDQGPYYVDSGIDGKTNPFEYFFDPITEIRIQEARKSFNVVFANPRTYRNIALRYEEDKDLNLFSNLVKKYYVLREPLKIRLDNEIEKLLNDKKTLGIQIRGVDWGNIEGHPIPPSLEKYVEEIDKAIAQCGFEQIFLATDAEETVEFISNKYPNKVVVYKDVARAPKGSKTLAIFDNNIKRENNGFLLGYEVLRDMLTLASCQGLVASYSNVSFATEVTKKSWDAEFEYKHIIKADINKKGMSSEKAIKLQKQGKFKG